MSAAAATLRKDTTEEEALGEVRAGWGRRSRGGRRRGRSCVRRLLKQKGGPTDFGEGDEAKTEVVKQLFAQIDADHDTKISRAEFTAAIQTPGSGYSGIGLKYQELLFSHLDGQGTADGEITEDELVAGLFPMRRRRVTRRSSPR